MGTRSDRSSLIDVLVERAEAGVLRGLVVTSSCRREGMVVRAHGELDTIGLARLQAVCGEASLPPGSTLVLDLDGVSSADAGAPGFLARLEVDLAAADVRVLVRCSNPIRRRLASLEAPPDPDPPTTRRVTMLHRSRSRKVAAGLLAGALLFGGACSDDDGDGDPEVDTPDVTAPDLDPGAGDGAPGDDEDEAPGDNPDSPDLDPGTGEGGPGDSDDEG